MGPPPATTAIPRDDDAPPVLLSDDSIIDDRIADDVGDRVDDGRREDESPRAYSAVDDEPPRSASPDRPIDHPEVPVAARPRPAGTNRNAIWALVLSVLGITSPIGIYLGHRAKTTIRRTRELGEPFATAALWIGYAWATFFVLGFIGYFWITAQGS